MFMEEQFSERLQVEMDRHTLEAQEALRKAQDKQRNNKRRRFVKIRIGQSVLIR